MIHGGRPLGRRATPAGAPPFLDEPVERRSAAKTKAQMRRAHSDGRVIQLGGGNKWPRRAKRKWREFNEGRN
jgi:hypothetical protein